MSSAKCRPFCPREDELNSLRTGGIFMCQWTRSLDRHQTITWTDYELLSIVTLGIHFNEIWYKKEHIFSRKCTWKSCLKNVSHVVPAFIYQDGSCITDHSRECSGMKISECVWFAEVNLKHHLTNVGVGMVLMYKSAKIFCSRSFAYLRPFWIIFFHNNGMHFWCTKLGALVLKRSQYANFIATGDTDVCHNDNVRCYKGQHWHQDDCLFSLW